jgi:hypothetical protein
MPLPGFSVRERASLALVIAGFALAGCIPTAVDPDGGGPLRTCINENDHVCAPDPGSVPVNCDAEEQGLEFAPFMLADYEAAVSKTVTVNGQSGQTINYTGARYTYLYFDGTSRIVPMGFSYFDGNRTVIPSGYEPPTQAMSRCGNDPNNHVFHLTGGPFLGWGGGTGIGMMHLSQELPFQGRTGLCPESDRNNPDRPSYCSPATFDTNVTFASINASDWEGVAVWARRGPDSQPLLRVLVGNKDTDDDIAYLMYDITAPNKPLYCQRVRDCSCTFQDNTCDFYATIPTNIPMPDVSLVPGYYCGPPGSTPSSYDTGANYCNTTSCDAVYSAYPNNGPDPQFFGKSCSAFTYRSGVTTSLCYDPGKDPPPAESDQQCGDHFTFPLHLTTDWHLYLVPFSQMYQQGFGKKASSFDLTTVSLVRLTWDAGFIDYYVDNLRFYRHAKP